MGERVKEADEHPREAPAGGPGALEQDPWAGADTIVPTTRSVRRRSSVAIEADDAQIVARMRRPPSPPLWLWGAGLLVLGLGFGHFLLARARPLGSRSTPTAPRAPGAVASEDQAFTARSRGALAANVVERAVAERASPLRRCWLHARSSAANTAPLGAEVVINVDIRDTGAVGSVRLVDLPPDYPGLGACVGEEAQSWLFPVATGETVARIALRFGGPQR